MSLGCDTKTDVKEDIERVLINAEKNMYRQKTLNVRMVNSDIINTIIATLFAKTGRERKHSIEVADLCQNFGEYINMPEEELKKMRTAAYLHDIGKVVFSPQQILNSNKLCDDKRNELRAHPLIGYRILNSFDNTVDLADIVLAHHEHWDGTGYPKGLKGEEIPPLARIISIAECYERVLNGKDESEPGDKESALKFITDRSGICFDPKVVDSFIDFIKISESKVK
jgi:putative nucleotidyltransferase with HDIG domain